MSNRKKLKPPKPRRRGRPAFRLGADMASAGGFLSGTSASSAWRPGRSARPEPPEETS